MASSSSSVPARRSTYDVFLSFRGEDTRKNFVDHLHASLVQRGINTFKDDKMLRKGESISPELLKAIEESRFAVVVFSENYANSSWCLDELVKIMECKDRLGQRVLPVFYHVDPSDVRRQKRKFATAFQEHEEKFRGDMDKLNKWREALAAASNLSGWHISESVNGGESEFINKIVSEILGNTKPHGMENNLIGIESHMDALNCLLDMQATEEVSVMGIWGMGGIGKTTIAQALFRRIAHKFEGNSFVKNVRENSSNEKDTCSLQEKILGDVLMTQHGFKIQDPDFGAYMIQQRLSNKKVLLVLDDVDDVKQLEFLAATHEWFGPGSRIIITTRNEHVLSDANAKYKPVLLLMDQALELFSRHAFKKNSPPEGYEELSYRAIRYAGCLPLALKVLGSFFRGRKAGVWESALDRLAKTPNTEIFGTLKLSFDGLDVSEKKIFLDIACFFKGGDEEYVTRIVDSFGFDPVIGISVLIEKSLITVSENRLDMHDLIQEMGWQIVRESFSNSRVWQIKDMHDLIKRNKKLKAIEGIVLRNQEFILNDYGEELGFSPEVFRSMENLRLLDIQRRLTSHEPTSLPNELRWLSWYSYPFFSLPLEHMCNLVGLEMMISRIDHLWEGQKSLPNLKFVNLAESRLTRFPDVSGAPNIEKLILSGCVCLVEVHESLGFLRRLVYLNMSGCEKLKCLPSRIEMESLETLILSHCKSLERIPEVSPCMVKLSSIHLDSCCLIEELPSSIKYLSGLSLLNLTRTNLKNIPNSVCELGNLKCLYLHKCEKLLKLPEELGTLEKLEELQLGCYQMGSYEALPGSINLHSLTSLCSLRKLDLSWRHIEEEDFPQNLDALFSLEELNLSGNSKLIQLHASISHLSNLKLLQLNDCHRLQNLNALPSGLQVLKARGCSSLEQIGDLSKGYEWLYKIWLFDCPKLLEDQEIESYLDKMLERSFLEKCASVNHRLSIAIPGSKIPSWFKEEQHGCNISLKLPPKWHTRIMGFAVCGAFHGDWKYASPQIIFKIVNDAKVIPKPKSNCINPSTTADNGNLWISYIPFSFFQQMYHDFQPEDWSHIEGNLVMTVRTSYGNESVRCGAHIVHKEDVESIQQIENCISDYGNLVHVDANDCHDGLCYDIRASSNTYVYEENSNNKNSQMPLRTIVSQRRDMYKRSVVFSNASTYNRPFVFTNSGTRKSGKVNRGRYPRISQDSA